MEKEINKTERKKKQRVRQEEREKDNSKYGTKRDQIPKERK